jgi:glycine hydroxymethyltransferase
LYHIQLLGAAICLHLFNKKYSEVLTMKDKIIRKLIKQEKLRQRNTIELIASENFVSKEILKAQGSILTNKYAEGYPKKRYYGGCYVIDEIEQLAINRAKKLFGADHANVQPHSGSQANAAVFLAVLNPGDKILAMSLNEGGHLTHGHKLNFSGKIYDFVHYGVDRVDHLINYDEVEALALEHKPKMIIAGASAYSRIIDYKRMKEIADKVNAYLLVDMAHIAGLVAAKLIPSPVPYADFVTTTTHKTLRGPRSGLILSKAKHAKAIDMAVFPGTQGGPLEHIIAAKAICFEEASTENFKKYIGHVIFNTKILSQSLSSLNIISNGTDNHLVLVDVTPLGVTGKEAEEILDTIGITCNKNTIPFDPLKPAITSGIRLGTAAMTTRGFTYIEFQEVGEIIVEALRHRDKPKVLKKLKRRVKRLLGAAKNSHTFSF